MLKGMLIVIGNRYMNVWRKMRKVAHAFTNITDQNAEKVYLCNFIKTMMLVMLL